MRTLTAFRGLVFLVALAGSAAVRSDPPKPKTDAEQLEGTWELPLGEGKAMHQITFRDSKAGQFQIVRPTEKAGEFEFLGAAGFAYKLDTRGKKKVLLLDNCLWFDGKKAEIEYELVDGKLRLGEGKTSKDTGGISLKGDWSRPKK